MATMIIGDDILMANLRVQQDKMNHQVAKALQKAGGEIIRVAIPKTPLKTGELRKRSFNEGPLLKDEVYSQVVGYEKFGADWESGGKAYAVEVHEDLEARHKIGGAKFLERAVDETAPKLGKYLQKEVHV
ncbi:MAG: hypothetical protein PHF65_07765 [Oscillospiraceae bacterium]|nr:hypothetical protein [Oscillospiraceae bacterium]